MFEVRKGLSILNIVDPVYNGLRCQNSNEVDIVISRPQPQDNSFDLLDSIDTYPSCNLSRFLFSPCSQAMWLPKISTTMTSLLNAEASVQGTSPCPFGDLHLWSFPFLRPRQYLITLSVITLTQTCDRQNDDNDNGYINCVCSSTNAASEIPACEACVANFDRNDGHDNGIPNYK